MWDCRRPLTFSSSLSDPHLQGYSIYQYTAGIPGRDADPQPIIFAYIRWDGLLVHCCLHAACMLPLASHKLGWQGAVCAGRLD